MASSASKHVVIFPFMAQGHTIPLLDLSKMLAHHGVKITIVTTPANSPIILHTLSQSPKILHKICLKELIFPVVDDLPKGCENTDQLPSWNLHIPFLLATKKLQQKFEEFLHELIKNQEKPNFIISDFFLGWTQRSAIKFKIPRLVFHGMGVFAMCVRKSLYVNMPHKHIKSETQPFLVPGMPKPIYLTKADLHSPMKDLNPADPFYQFITETAEPESRSCGVIANSFIELESDYVSCLESFYHGRVWCVGPVSLCNKLETEKIERGKASTEIQSTACMAWLNEQRRAGSVIYVSFGTQAEVCDAQLDEIAYGLEESGVGFVWVMRSNSWCFPDGFEEKVKGRGLIMREWAPQLLVLSHVATGGFLSHCGWNSVIESISAGVPILAWPMIAEQGINAKFVVDEAGAGLRLRLHSGWGAQKIVEREMVSQGVRELMVGEKGKVVREKARDLGEAAKKAIEEGGSSHKALSSLMDQLCPGT